MTVAAQIIRYSVTYSENADTKIAEQIGGDARPQNLWWLIVCDRLGATAPGRRVVWRGKPADGPTMMIA